MLDNDGVVAPNWKSLFEEFQHRFFIGTDVKLGDEDTDYQIAEAHRRIVRQPPSNAARKIAWGNAAKLLRLKKLPVAANHEE